MKAITVVLHRLLLGAMTAWLFVFPLISGHAFGQVRENEHENDGGKVYVMSNFPTGNTVMVFNRAEDGKLAQIQEVATGGLGSGAGVLPPPLPPNRPGPDPLQSQDALVMTENGRFLLVVNAGSNEISVLAADDGKLKLSDKVPSGGQFPVSIAVHNNLVYVLNEGESPDHAMGGVGNITGFSLDDAGKLHAIPNSARVLGPDTGVSDVLFSPDGRQLIVTEMFTNKIDVFQMAEGRPDRMTSISSNNPTPFGASFGRDNVLAVTEIDVITVDGRRTGVANASTTSSYRLTPDGSLQPVSKAIPSNRTGSCWVRFSRDGRFAYTGDTGAGTISIYSVSPEGKLSLQGLANTGGAFSAPVDLDVTPDGKFLYVVIPFGLIEHVPPLLPLPAEPVGRIQGYRIEQDGSLTPVTTVGGVPFHAQGIVAR